MKKYKYEKVESIRDVDFSGDTTYYHKDGFGESVYDVREKIPSCTECVIEVGRLFTRKEAPWWENIPEHGILCDISGEGIRLIIECWDDIAVDDNTDSHPISNTHPLTDNEIKKFLRGEWYEKYF